MSIYVTSVPEESKIACDLNPLPCRAKVESLPWNYWWRDWCGTRSCLPFHLDLFRQIGKWAVQYLAQFDNSLYPKQALVYSYFKSRTKSIISWKYTSTEHEVKFLWFAELWMRSESFPCLIFFALNPKTKRSESMTFDFPEPFGPTMEVNDYQISFL